MGTCTVAGAVHRLLFTHDYEAALPLLRRAVVTPREEEIRAVTLNNLAWTLLIVRPDGWLEEADLASPPRSASPQTRIP